ncbi:MAG: hypothetical protein H0W78_03225 [Planctomycetes bacterium]|nr:hypothetical protein [Planctomycetota bacterium]
MRLSLTLGLIIATTAIHAADEPYQIARWGNALLVTAPGGPGMSPAIAAKLNQRVTLDFQDAALTDVVDFLRSVSHINIVVAPAVTLTSPTITLKAKDMSLGNTLHWLTKLSNTHMGFIHGALFISNEPVKEASVTRMYDISDMTMAIRDFPGPELALSSGGQNGGGGALFGPVDDSESSSPTTEEITDIIKKVVAPGKWSD